MSDKSVYFCLNKKSKFLKRNVLVSQKLLKLPYRTEDNVCVLDLKHSVQIFVVEEKAKNKPSAVQTVCNHAAKLKGMFGD